MPLIRKERAGNDSFGNHWPKDGVAVEVEAEHAAALLAISDGGFTEVTPPADEEPQKPAAPEDPEEEKEVSEVDPEAPADEPEAAPAAKKTAARKTAGRKPVEE